MQIKKEVEDVKHEEGKMIYGLFSIWVFRFEFVCDSDQVEEEAQDGDEGEENNQQEETEKGPVGQRIWPESDLYFNCPD